MPLQEGLCSHFVPFLYLMLVTQERACDQIAMPEFYAVQCFQCEQYQVAQARKDRRFSCKLCGAKQSVRRIFARSHAAKDVRSFIQEMNYARGMAAEAYDDHLEAGLSENCDGDSTEDKPNTQNVAVASKREIGPTNPSRWAGFLPYKAASVHENSPADDSDNSCDETRFVTSMPDDTEKARGQTSAGRRANFTSKRKNPSSAVDRQHRLKQQQFVGDFDSTLENSCRAREACEDGIDGDQAYTLAASGDTIVEDEICF